MSRPTMTVLNYNVSEPEQGLDHIVGVDDSVLLVRSINTLEVAGVADIYLDTPHTLCEEYSCVEHTSVSLRFWITYSCIAGHCCHLF
jgi:hypothetical protein